MSKAILLLEDETHHAARFKALLRGAGLDCELVIARGAREALALFRTGRRFGSRDLPAMVLVPAGLDAVALVEKLRARKRTGKVPVFVLSPSVDAPRRLQ